MHITFEVGRSFIEENGGLLAYVNDWAGREVATLGGAGGTETAYKVETITFG